MWINWVVFLRRRYAWAKTKQQRAFKCLPNLEKRVSCLGMSWGRNELVTLTLPKSRIVLRGQHRWLLYSPREKYTNIWYHSAAQLTQRQCFSSCFFLYFSLVCRIPRRSPPRRARHRCSNRLLHFIKKKCRGVSTSFLRVLSVLLYFPVNFH